MSRPARVLLALLGPLALTGCFPDVEVSRHLDVELDHPRSVIETALASCDSRSEDAEVVCVKQALIDRDVTVAALPGLIPGCRWGRECHVDYTTENRIGFVPAVASDYIAHWRVTIDLRQKRDAVEDVPITVDQI